MDTRLSIPQYIIDLEKLHKDTEFGEIKLPTITKSNGRITKLVANFCRSIRFRRTDDAVLYVADVLRNLPRDKTGKVTLEVEHKHGQVITIKHETEEAINYE